MFQDIDISVTPSELAMAIIGQVRRCKTSMVMCSVAAVRRITAAGRILLGWV